MNLQRAFHGLVGKSAINDDVIFGLNLEHLVREAARELFR